MTKLNVGCWTHAIPDYLGVDAQAGPGVDVVAMLPGDALPLEPGSIEAIYAGHFLEHLPPWDVIPFLEQMTVLLAPGGTLTLIVPDVRRIRLLEEDRNHATLQELSNLKIGQAVRLRHTALSGIEGLIQSVSSKRVAVLLEILGRPTLVQLEHHQVEVADS